MVDAASRLILANGTGFTTQELVKEAGIALQTFYRYFPSKDQLMLAVLEDMIGQSCVEYERSARELRGPVERLKFYVRTILAPPAAADGERDSRQFRQFITSEHWRLYGLYPEEVAEATKPVTDLILREVRSAADAGMLDQPNPDYNSWLVMQLLMAVFHHYAFDTTADSADETAEQVWTFCLSALGGDRR
jgi:TetR/AcrR family transcriptional regulator